MLHILSYFPNIAYFVIIFLQWYIFKIQLNATNFIVYMLLSDALRKFNAFCMLTFQTQTFKLSINLRIRNFKTIQEHDLSYDS